MERNRITREEMIQEYFLLGNNCVQHKKYREAVVYYNHAILLDPRNYILHSNRSLVLLKIKDYSGALEDAEIVIELTPHWAKGYFRKAQVLCATYNLRDAIVSYEQALLLDPNNIIIKTQLEYTRIRSQIYMKVDKNLSWLGIPVPIIITLLYIIADIFFSEKTSFKDPFLIVFYLIYVAVEGYVATCKYRNYLETLKGNIHLRPDRLPDPDDSTEYVPRGRRNHGS